MDYEILSMLLTAAMLTIPIIPIPNIIIIDVVHTLIDMDIAQHD
jgi:hypothetical protein